MGGDTTLPHAKNNSNSWVKERTLYINQHVENERLDSAQSLEWTSRSRSA